MIALAPGDGPARIGVLDRNRAVLTRAARAVRAACGLAPVAVDSDPAGLRAALAPDARLLICDEADVDLAREWATTRFPELQIVAWSHGPMEGLVAAATGDTRLRSLIGWPAFESMPRPWELALAVRRSRASCDRVRAPSAMPSPSAPRSWRCGSGPTSAPSRGSGACATSS